MERPTLTKLVEKRGEPTVFVARNFTIHDIEVVRQGIRRAGFEDAVVILLGEGQALDQLSEEDMERHGWVRKR